MSLVDFILSLFQFLLALKQSNRTAQQLKKIKEAGWKMEEWILIELVTFSFLVHWLLYAISAIQPIWEQYNRVITIWGQQHRWYEGINRGLNRDSAQ